MTHRLGKAPKVLDSRNLRLANYATTSTACIPSAIDWSPAVKTGLMRTGWPTYRNTGDNAIGDCTVAAAAHMIECWSANTRPSPIIVGEAEVVSVYSKLSGYKEGDSSTDNGLAILDLLKYWKNTGIDGNNIEAFVEINSSSKKELMAALYWFGGVNIGLMLPNSAKDQETWTVCENDGGIWGGHCINIVAADANTVKLITWGEIKVATLDFIMKYADEAYAILDCGLWLGSNGLTLSSLDINSLRSDLAAITQL